MPDHCFNEAARPGLIAQPSNSWSSLGFAVVAVMVAARRPRVATAADRPAVATTPALRVLLAFALLVTGLGSAFYHASLTFIGQTADVAGMYLLSTFVILYARADGRADAVRRFVTAYAAFNAVLLVALILVPELRRQLFAVLLLIGLVLEYRRGTRTPALAPRALLASALTLAVAFAIWIADMRHVGPSPTSWLQGHAVWHLLGALSTWQLARYYDGRVLAD